MNEKWLIVYPKMNEIENPNSRPDTSRWLLSLLLVAFLFYFSTVISLLQHCHLQQVHVLFNVGVFVTCMLPLPYSFNIRPVVQFFIL